MATWGPIQLRLKGSRQVEFDGEASPAPGGGSKPVATWLYATTDIDLGSASSTDPFWIWDTIYDNIVNENILADLPDGIGIDPASIGTDTLVFTEDGIWAFSLLGVGFGNDATWDGQLNFGDFSNAGITNLPVSAGAGLPRLVPPFCQVIALPAGTGVAIGFVTNTPATQGSLIVGFSGLSIVRLA